MISCQEFCIYAIYNTPYGIVSVHWFDLSCWLTCDAWFHPLDPQVAQRAARTAWMRTAAPGASWASTSYGGSAPKPAPAISSPKSSSESAPRKVSDPPPHHPYEPRLSGKLPFSPALHPLLCPCFCSALRGGRVEWLEPLFSERQDMWLQARRGVPGAGHPAAGLPTRGRLSPNNGDQEVRRQEEEMSRWVPQKRIDENITAGKYVLLLPGISSHILWVPSDCKHRRNKQNLKGSLQFKKDLLLLLWYGS